MTLQARIGAGEARGVLAEARALGETGVLSHRGAAGVTLYMILGKSSIKPIQAGSIVEEARVTILIIPTGQTGFDSTSDDTEPLTPGDTVVKNSRTYYIMGDIQSDPPRKVFTASVTEDKRLANGLVL